MTADDAMPRMIEALSACRRVLLTTHARPDADALGTTAAMALGLAKKGIEAECLILSEMPAKYAFLYDEPGVTYHNTADGADPAKLLDGADALLVCDTGTWSQLNGMRPAVEAFAGKKLVLDHHKTQEDWADLKLVDTTAGAAAEVAMMLLNQWGVEIDAAMAEVLYAAMAMDTGWFAFSNTTPRTMRLAAECLEAGADVERLYQRLYQGETERRMRLHARGHASMQLLAGGRVAVTQLTKADFAETGAGMPATEDLINWPMAIGSVGASIFLCEDPGSPDGLPTKVSLRSKGQIDASALAQGFGGGGHARAAGARLDVPLAEARERVIAAVTAAL